MENQSFVAFYQVLQFFLHLSSSAKSEENVSILDKKIFCKQIIDTMKTEKTALDYFSRLANLAAKLCPLEALAFHTEEVQQEIGTLRVVQEQLREEGQRVHLPTGLHSQARFRLFLGLGLSQLEWCENVGFAQATPDQQMHWLLESPAASWHIFVKFSN